MFDGNSCCYCKFPTNSTNLPNKKFSLKQPPHKISTLKLSFKKPPSHKNYAVNGRNSSKKHQNDIRSPFIYLPYERNHFLHPSIGIRS